MKSIYIVDYYSTAKSNGLSTYVTQLSEGLAKQDGIRLHFVWINSTTYKIFEKKTIKNTTHYYIPRHIAALGDNTGFDIKVAEYLAAEMRGQENIIVHFNWINHCPFAYLLKEKINCKTLLTKHCIPWRDLITDNYLAFIRLNDLYEDNTPLLSIDPPALARERFSYETMDHIICVTGSGKQSLQKLFHFPDDRLSVIYNGLCLSEVDGNIRLKQELRDRYGISGEEKILLFAGSVTERKGSYDLVRVFDRFAREEAGRKLRLVIAGTGDHNKLLSHVKTSWTKITITGNLTKRQLYDFYAMADIGIIPSYVEQCSYTAIEMMSMGLPLIVADVDGLKEIVPDGCGLRVKRKLNQKSAEISAKDLINQMRCFLENEGLAQSYAARAKKHALELFSAERMAKQTVEVYRELLEENELNTPDSVWPGLEPLVSILLPCYNAETYLENCIESVLLQSYRNFEFIIVDDGSTDNTSSIIQRFDNERIKYLKSKVNKGIVHALNKAVSIASGKYIARIDADDKMQFDRIGKQVQYLENQEDVALVGSWHYVINPTDKIIGMKEYPVQDWEIKLLMPFMNSFSHPSVMVRTDVLKELGYTNEYNYCEDYDLWTKIADRHQVANIAECLTFFRVHPDNAKATYLKKQRQSALELVSCTLEGYGIEHSVEELAVHAAMNSGKSRQYFTSKEKQEVLKNWVGKVLANLQQRYGISGQDIKKVEDYLLFDRCGLPFNTVVEKEPVQCLS